MSTQTFHLLMLLLIGGMSCLSWHGYRSYPWGKRTALKWNAVLALWFAFVLLAIQSPGIEVGPEFIRLGILLFAFVLAINARRLVLGAEFLIVHHPARAAIFAALRSGRPVDPRATASLMFRTQVSDAFIPALRRWFLVRQAEEARALREKLDADAELAEAIVRRERARERAAAAKSRRRDGPDAWRAVLGRQR